MTPIRARLASYFSIAGRLCFLATAVFGIFEMIGWIGHGAWPRYTFAGMTHTMAISGVGWLAGIEEILNEVLYAPAWLVLLGMGLLLRVLGGIAALGADRAKEEEE